MTEVERTYLTKHWDVLDKNWKWALNRLLGHPLAEPSPMAPTGYGPLLALIDLLRDRHLDERELSWIPMPRAQRALVYEEVAKQLYRYDHRVRTKEFSIFAEIMLYRDDLYEALREVPLDRPYPDVLLPTGAGDFAADLKMRSSRLGW